ncbi:hypothetical protein [Streptomyces sp. WM6372]|uniref:hypothetical protein n=1 Tax=Streptomyces sp. WM6372 TaxID=1415555 RepID=UPI00131AA682|nr:hypothetical protein [Streptomyces sp. WM6372]
MRFTGAGLLSGVEVLLTRAGLLSGVEALLTRAGGAATGRAGQPALWSYWRAGGALLVSVALVAAAFWRPAP